MHLVGGLRLCPGPQTLCALGWAHSVWVWGDPARAHLARHMGGGGLCTMGWGAGLCHSSCWLLTLVCLSAEVTYADLAL